jgi:hypothetical protein
MFSSKRIKKRGASETWRIDEEEPDGGLVWW